MKRFILKTILIIIPFLVFVIIIELLIRNIPNDYSYKNEYLTNNSNDLEILVLGSSYTFRGIDTDYFNFNSFNAAMLMQTFEIDYKIYKKFEDKFNNLKLIILPITYNSLWNILSESQKHNWLEKNYSIYYSIYPDNFSLYKYFELLNGPVIENLKSLRRCYILKQKKITCNQSGFNYTDYSPDLNFKDFGYETALKHRYELNKENLARYSKIVEILESFIYDSNNKNISILFITTPSHSSYRDNFNLEQLYIMYNTIKMFLNKYENIFYLDLMDCDEFLEVDFHDSDHVNGEGAKKLSIMVSNYINSLEIF